MSVVAILIQLLLLNTLTSRDIPTLQNFEHEIDEIATATSERSEMAMRQSLKFRRATSIPPLTGPHYLMNGFKFNIFIILEINNIL